MNPPADRLNSATPNSDRMLAPAENSKQIICFVATLLSAAHKYHIYLSCRTSISISKLENNYDINPNQYTQHSYTDHNLSITALIYRWTWQSALLARQTTHPTRETAPKDEVQPRLSRAKVRDDSHRLSPANSNVDRELSVSTI